MLREVLLALLGGFGQSLQLFCYTLLGALPLGLVIAFGSMTRWRPLQKAVRGLVWVVRGTPLMLQLIVIYYGPGLLIRDGNLWGGGGVGRMAAAATIVWLWSGMEMLSESMESPSFASSSRQSL